ncbi:VCBS repeat-containing protein [Phormidium pseudopriestleyi FRX01]|uniref:VCBS repeat-containing protein n=1 Tax=Phormidium pseudopriestleyi FRX01 TaxID=1759528 RepID=A0ABS3FUF7_9CYAN|nr:VCBS repeat-containing protein [Phormidium pseudopriestleyi FRX01]
MDDYQTLAAGITPSSEVHILDPHRDGIEQITEILSPGSSSLHLISHGTPGTLYLGNSILNRQTLGNYATELQQWAIGQLYIYGCEVAAVREGQQFLQQLHEHLPIAIYANPHPTGNSALGGTWNLQQIFPQWEQEDGNWEWVMSDGTHNKGQKTKDKRQRTSNSTPFSPHTLATYAHTLGFAPYTNFPVGTWPESVYIGDVNGDGHDDLAVANQNSNNVSILLGDGSGSFGTQTTFAVGSGSFSVAVGDFDGDGKSDLAAANGFDNTVSILLGDGSGSFGTQTTFPVGAAPISVNVADLNGDGNDDLAMANRDGYSVSVLLGDGSGGFEPQTSFLVGSAPVSLTIGDFNGDGTSDLAVANRDSNTVSVLPGDGNGSFGTQTTFAVGSRPIAITGGDFNGDGKDDLAIANNFDNNVSVLLGDGRGGFTQTTFAVGTWPMDIKVGDFNGDGKSDLATTNELDETVSVLLGDGNGGFASPATFDVGSSPYLLNVGDFNEDGKDDLVTTNFSSNNLSVLLNQTAKVTSVTATTPDGRYGVGQTIPIAVTFDQIVNVTGTPGLQLETGTPDRYAIYDRGSGSDTLTFNYVVQEGDSSADLEYLSNTALSLNGATIQDQLGENAQLTLPALGSSNSLAGSKAIVIDGFVSGGNNPNPNPNPNPTPNPTPLPPIPNPTPPGVFVVGDDGRVNVEFLFDGSNYEGEVAFFSIEGMENLQVGSREYIREAARRALNPNQGHVVISDYWDQPLFSNGFSEFGGFNWWNRGGYRGIQNFAMTPGTEFAMMLVPHGTVRKVLNEIPFLSGPSIPFFSNHTIQSQMVDLTGNGNTFAWEDMPITGYSDRDYNDIIFQISGATGSAPSVDDWISPWWNWRNSFLGQNIINYTNTGVPNISSPPVIIDRSITVVTVTIISRAIDGYIAGADAFFDANKNGVRDDNEPTSTTNEEGLFEFEASLEAFDTNGNGELDPEEGHIVISGGIDTANGLPLETPLTATPDSQIVSLLTSLVAEAIDQGLSPLAANQKVKQALSLPDEVDLSTFDPIAATEEGIPGGVETNLAMVQVQNVVTQTAALLDGASSLEKAQISRSVVNTLANAVLSQNTLDLNSAEQLQRLIAAATQNVAAIDPTLDVNRILEMAADAATVMAAANQQKADAVANGETDINGAIATHQKVSLGTTTDEFFAAGFGNLSIAEVVENNTGENLTTRISSATPADPNPGGPLISPAPLINPLPSASEAIAPLNTVFPELANLTVPQVSPNPEATSLDNLIGTNAADAIIGDSGSNFLQGLEGNDNLYGNDANDTIHGNQGTDYIAAGAGDDWVHGGKDDDAILGGDGSDRLYGDLGNDVIFGENGNDFVNGNQGNDWIDGGDGDDVLHGGQDDDTLKGGAGTDELYGDLGNDLILGEADNDFLYGNQGDDTLDGGDGDDVLWGGNGNDILIGGNGDDWLLGDLGDDTMVGGAGSDRFVIRPNAGTDLIVDFTDGEDLIGLAEGLSFENLTLTQGNTGTLIYAGNNLLATVNGVDVSLIGQEDFFSVG